MRKEERGGRRGREGMREFATVCPPNSVDTMIRSLVTITDRSVKYTRLSSIFVSVAIKVLPYKVAALRTDCNRSRRHCALCYYALRFHSTR